MTKPLTGRGVNAQREILSPSADIGKDVRDLRSASPFPNFCRAVVVDVLFDPDSMTTDQLASIKESVSNQELVDNIPRNSIIARVITNAKDRRDSKGIICYPFFPQHFAMPVKPGEQVWIMFENPNDSLKQGFWICRITEPGHVDDVNFTHADRKFDRSTSQTTAEKAKAKTNPEIVRPGFNNGNDKNSQTLQGTGDYDDIAKNAEASKHHRSEPVPRFVKRPGDAVLQGSNNALIVVGEDRTGPASDKPKNEGFAGTIDIVAGRGRFLPAEGENPTDTAPKVIKNTRGKNEVDKNPKANGGKGNLKEGDPDFKNDASRVYVSMKTDGDENFGTKPDQLPLPFKEFREYKAAAFSGIRTDHIRFIARKDTKHGINGSIRIIKEGNVGDDQAGILMEPDGTVHMDGKTIFLGRPGGNGPGEKGSEPYIKFSDFKQLMTDILSDLSKFTTGLAKTFATNTTPGFGAPCPQLTLSATNECAVLLTSIQNRITQIDKVKSVRIFGE